MAFKDLNLKCVFITKVFYQFHNPHIAQFLRKGELNAVLAQDASGRIPYIGNLLEWPFPAWDVSTRMPVLHQPLHFSNIAAETESARRSGLETRIGKFENSSKPLFYTYRYISIFIGLYLTL